ncbi:MAG: hypothetical protein VW338_07740 [Rhodospirillaceae bacterium]
MPLNPLRGLLAAVGLFILAGCFDLHQSMEVTADAVHYELRLRLNAAIVQLGMRDAGKFCETNDELRVRTPAAMTRTIRQSFDGDDIVCILTLKGPLDALTSFGIGAKTGDLNDLLKIQQLDKSMIRIDSTFKLRKNPSPEERAMLGTMTQGRAVSWLVRAPRIEDSNGDVSADRKSVTWQVPMSVAVQSD